MIQNVLKLKSKKFSYEELREKYQVLKQLEYINGSFMPEPSCT